MTTPEVKTIKRDGSRFYVDPVSGEKVPSVTSIVGCLPKRALQFWRGKMVAECAVEDFGVLADFVSKGDCLRYAGAGESSMRRWRIAPTTPSTTCTHHHAS